MNNKSEEHLEEKRPRHRIGTTVSMYRQREWTLIPEELFKKKTLLKKYFSKAGKPLPSPITNSLRLLEGTPGHGHRSLPNRCRALDGPAPQTMKSRHSIGRIR